MWMTEHAIETSASLETIWEFWKDVENWKNWDLGLENSRLDGEFIAGTKGFLTPQGNQTLEFILTNVENLKRFDDQTDLPGVSLIFEHEMQNNGSINQITHRIKIFGPNMEQFVAARGSHFQESSRKSLEKLIEIAESKQLFHV